MTQADNGDPKDAHAILGEYLAEELSRMRQFREEMEKKYPQFTVEGGTE
jgi:hypothetical protein